MGRPQAFNLFELLWQSEGLNPQTSNLFDLLWQREELNPNPKDLNLVLYILAKISCKN